MHCRQTRGREKVENKTVASESFTLARSKILDQIVKELAYCKLTKV